MTTTQPVPPDPAELARLNELTVTLNSGDKDAAMNIFRAGPWTTPAAYQVMSRNRFEAGEYDDSEKIAQDGAAMFSADVELRDLRAMALLELARYDDVLAMFATAAPDRPLALYIWGQALYFTGKPRAAIVKFRRVYELEPQLDSMTPTTRGEFFNYWGNALVDARRFAEAREKYQLAVTHNPGSGAVAGHNLALVHYLLEEWYEAMLGYEAVRNLPPGEDVTLMALSLAQWKCGLFSEAERTISEAAAKSDAIAPPFNRARMYWSAGRFADARREVVALQEILNALTDPLKKPDTMGSLTGVPEVFATMLVDGLGAAEQLLADVNEHVPASSEYETAERHLLRGRILLAKAERTAEQESRLKWRSEAFSECRAAAVLVRRVIDEEKGRAATEPELQILIRAYLLCESYAEAKKYLGDAAKLPSRCSSTEVVIGLLHMQSKNLVAAIRAFDAAVVRDATSLENRILLAEALLRAGDLERAESEVREILKLAPLNVDARIQLGRLQIELGEKSDVDGYEEAVRQLTRALRDAGTPTGSRELMPRERAMVFYLRGFALTRQYDEQKVMKDPSLLISAREDFVKCLAEDPDNHRAGAALRRIDDRLKPRIGGWISDRVAGVSCAALSLGVFATATYRFADGLLKPGSAGFLMFGSLFFFIVSFYMPQLLKLKVGSVELEKAAVDSSIVKLPLQISKAPNSLGRGAV